jgi:divalent metal cation (Fe/Co/Zn/Cd) transporter
MLGIFVNGTLATAKFIGGILGNSYALIADAVESMTDIFSSFVVWRGLSGRHPAARFRPPLRPRQS